MVYLITISILYACISLYKFLACSPATYSTSTLIIAYYSFAYISFVVMVCKFSRVAIISLFIACSSFTFLATIYSMVCTSVSLNAPRSTYHKQKPQNLFYLFSTCHLLYVLEVSHSVYNLKQFCKIHLK